MVKSWPCIRSRRPLLFSSETDRRRILNRVTQAKTGSDATFRQEGRIEHVYCFIIHLLCDYVMLIMYGEVAQARVLSEEAASDDERDTPARRAIRARYVQIRPALQGYTQYGSVRMARIFDRVATAIDNIIPCGSRHCHQTCHMRQMPVFDTHMQLHCNNVYCTRTKQLHCTVGLGVWTVHNAHNHCNSQTAVSTAS